MVIAQKKKNEIWKPRSQKVLDGRERTRTHCGILNAVAEKYI